MGFFRTIFAFIFPPLAVIDCGLGAIIWTTVGTICAWIPGIIAAFYFVGQKRQQQQHRELLYALKQQQK